MKSAERHAIIAVWVRNVAEQSGRTVLFRNASQSYSTSGKRSTDTTGTDVTRTVRSCDSIQMIWIPIMSLHRTLITITVLSLGVLLSSNAHAVEPGFLHTGDDNSDFTNLYDPFCDLDTCWFEPIDCDCADERSLNSGWFFRYSRTALRVSRPRNVGQVSYDPTPELGTPDDNDLIFSTFEVNEPSDYDGDLALGNRFDFGWVSDEGTGLWFIARKLDNPDEVVTFSNVDSNGDASTRPDEEPFGPTFITANGLQMWGFEGNKTWRLTPTPRGTVMEPFVGLRYVRLRDLADRNDVFNNFEDLNFPTFLPPGAVPGELELVRTIFFNYRQSIITTDNDLFGGQFGMRSRWRRGRWQVTSDLRGLMFWNHQVRETIEINEEQAENFQSTFSPAGVLQTVAETPASLLQDTTQTQTFETANTFVYGGELNLGLDFEVTQGFALNFGAEILAFADGVGRGNEGHDDSLVMAGFSLGFSLNR